jgi:hypothetical protein
MSLNASGLTTPGLLPPAPRAGRSPGSVNGIYAGRVLRLNGFKRHLLINRRSTFLIDANKHNTTGVALPHCFVSGEPQPLKAVV